MDRPVRFAPRDSRSTPQPGRPRSHGCGRAASRGASAREAQRLLRGLSRRTPWVPGGLRWRCFRKAHGPVSQAFPPIPIRSNSHNRMPRTFRSHRQAAHSLPLRSGSWTRTLPTGQGRCTSHARQCRRQEIRQRLPALCGAPEYPGTGLRAQEVPLRHAASLQDVRQRRRDGVAGALRGTERPALARRNHTRVPPAPRRWSRSPARRSRTEHRGRFPRRSSEAAVGQQGGKTRWPGCHAHPPGRRVFRRGRRTGREFLRPERRLDRGFLDRREVAKVGNVRVSMRQQRGAKRIDLGKPSRPEAQRLPGHGHRLNARTHAAVSQENPSWRLAKWLQGGVTT